MAKSPLESNNNKSLVTKLTEVQALILNVSKTGYNDFQKYSYAEERSIVESCRLALAERHIMILPSILDVNRAGDLTTIQTSYRIVDGDSGEEFTLGWAGTGSDKQDKGLPKAITTSHKYLLLKLFMIPTGESGIADDIEHNAHNQPVGVETVKDMSHQVPELLTIAEKHGTGGLRDAWGKTKYESYRLWVKSTAEGAAAHAATKKVAAKTTKSVKESIEQLGHDVFGAVDS
jgi:hypothetical protein|tara:strand:+ start:2964 stop:3659 length:696 start_codon:yes stop_codon:yes gene_type:complete